MSHFWSDNFRRSHQEDQQVPSRLSRRGPFVLHHFISAVRVSHWNRQAPGSTPGSHKWAPRSLLPSDWSPPTAADQSTIHTSDIFLLRLWGISTDWDKKSINQQGCCYKTLWGQWRWWSPKREVAKAFEKNMCWCGCKSKWLNQNIHLYIYERNVFKAATQINKWTEQMNRYESIKWGKTAESFISLSWNVKVEGLSLWSTHVAQVGCDLETWKRRETKHISSHILGRILRHIPDELGSSVKETHGDQNGQRRKDAWTPIHDHMTLSTSAAALLCIKMWPIFWAPRPPVIHQMCPPTDCWRPARSRDN